MTKASSANTQVQNMQREHPGNVEAVLNIFANAGEITGIAFGIWFILGAIAILFQRKWAVSGKLALSGIALLTLGLAIPGLVNLLVNAVYFQLHISTYDAEPWLVGLGILGCILVAANAIFCYFFPTIVAVKRNKENRQFLALLNCFLPVIPLGWAVVLFLSFSDDAAKIKLTSEENGAVEGNKI